MRNVKRRIVTAVIMVVMTVMLCSITKTTAKAEEIIAQGNCGAAGNEVNVTWELTSDGILTINGTGAMADYEDEDGKRAPWYDKRLMVNEIVIKGITVVGKRSFCGFKSSHVRFNGDSVEKIRESAFEDTYIVIEELPISLKAVEMAAFRNCLFSTRNLDLSGIETIEQYAFYNCECCNENFYMGSGPFDKIIIPGTIKTLPSYSIPRANYMIQIEEGVERIEDEAVSLGQTWFPSTIKYIADYSFAVSGVMIYGKNEYTHEWAFQHGCKYVDLNKKYDLTDYFIGDGYHDRILLENFLGETQMRFLNEEITYSNYQNDKQLNYNWRLIDCLSFFDRDNYIIKDDKCGEGSIFLNKDYDYSITIKNAIDNNLYSDDYCVTDVGSFVVTVSGKGIFCGEKTFIYNVCAVLGKNDVSLEYDRILCDGSEKKPIPKVMYRGRQLTEGVDYTVDYSNNIDEGNGIVTIKGKGLFLGEVKKTFEIYKTDLSLAEVNLSYTNIMYDGNEKTPSVTVKYGDNKLIENKDFQLDYSDNCLPGTASVKVIGINKYKGAVEKKFEIQGLSIVGASVMLKKCIYSYDGSPKTPPVEVKLGDKTLVKDTDYTLSYENNVNDGTAHAVVTGTGIYKDVIKVSFVILPYNAGMDAVYPEGTLIDDDYVYGVMDDETNEVEFFCPANQKLKSVHIPTTVTDENGTVYTVTSIGNKAFYKNTKITSVVIANTVKSIEDYAFYGCKNIKTLKIGSGVEVIGNSAFRKCTKLTAVTLPKSIDSLGKNCFYGCSKLKTITIDANSVVDVKANAIKGVSKKCVIKVPKKLVKKYKKEFNKKSGFTGGMKVKKK